MSFAGNFTNSTINALNTIIPNGSIPISPENILYTKYYMAVLNHTQIMYTDVECQSLCFYHLQTQINSTFMYWIAFNVFFFSSMMFMGLIKDENKRCKLYMILHYGALIINGVFVWIILF